MRNNEAMQTILHSENIDVITATNIVKTFGPTKAVSPLSFNVPSGAVIGLVGSNGAGKSTLMRILSGVLRPDDGQLSIVDNNVDFSRYSPKEASNLGIRCVYQELSLCSNLSVWENFYLEEPEQFKDRKWRKRASDMVCSSLEKVFPGSHIDPSALVGDLTIAERQMVEISRAAGDPNLKLLILDEPTSSLSVEQSLQLMNYIKKEKQHGLSFIFVSHRLGEVTSIADEIIVMKNGFLHWRGRSDETNEEHLVQLMSGALSGINENISPVRSAKKGEVVKIQIDRLNTQTLNIDNMKFCSGEIVGIAGLEGNGQRELLWTLYRSFKKNVSGISCKGEVVFVSGDRSREGIFPLWSIGENISITFLAQTGLIKLFNAKEETGLTKEWFDKFKIRGSSIKAPIVTLSGGSQQKALLARSLLAKADIILLDDPTRGVDVDTKRQLYSLFREVADGGKLIIWYSSEIEELTEADRVYVLREGHRVKELMESGITKDSIIEASFTKIENEVQRTGVKKREGQIYKGLMRNNRTTISLAIMMVVIGCTWITNPDSASVYGINMLFGPVIPLMFAALAQMFVMAGSEIDLSIGSYMAFINVVSANVLVHNLIYGIAIMILGVIGYGIMGAIIHLRKIPAIVMTLGASFIWYGIGISLQPVPGGSCPAWLNNLFQIHLVPINVVFALIFALIGFLVLMRSRYGIVLRGFGNSVQSIENSGWSSFRAHVSLYVLAGIFGTLGGLSLTAVTTAADPNVGPAYLLLSVAAVVLGGGEFFGGIVEPVGVVAGAIILSFLGDLLSFLNIGYMFQPASEGIMLFLVLILRYFGRRRTI